VRASGGSPTLEQQRHQRQRQQTVPDPQQLQAAPSQAAPPASPLLLLVQAVLGTATAAVVAFGNVMSGHASLTVVAAEVAADAGGCTSLSGRAAHAFLLRWRRAACMIVGTDLV